MKRKRKKKLNAKESYRRDKRKAEKHERKLKRKEIDRDNSR